jgi:N-acetylglucosamine-6-phosphate deacetylase
VVVSAGHTRATYEQMRHAVGLGVRQVTHLFNTMEPLHHRAPGVVGAALSIDALACEVIADNIHVHPAVLRLVVRAKGPERVLLVTDAMRGAGMPDGEYTLGRQRVLVRGAKDGAGEARLADDLAALAGSTLTMERAVANIMAAADLTLAQALPMATTNPARALGIEDRKGAIAVGMDGDMVALDADLHVRLTMVGGQVVYRAQDSHSAKGG